MANLLPKQIESSYVVRFSDSDPNGHLNNARFIDYFLNAREDQIAENYGLDVYAHGAETGNAWIVSKNLLSYLAPAMLHERVLIRTHILDFTERTITVEGLMMDETGTRLKAVLWCEFTYVSMTNGRPRPHDDEMMAFLGSIRDDGVDYDPDGFNQRIKALRNEFRAARRAANQNGAKAPA